MVVGDRYEINALVSSGGWVQTPDAPTSTVYAQSGNQWVDYDTPATLRTKVDAAASRGLGGCMVWTLDLDDFHGGYPLVTAARSQLVARGYQLTPGSPNPGPSTPPALSPSTPPAPSPSTPPAPGRPGRMIGYFTNWAQYRQGAGAFHPSDIDASLLTNLVYAFAAVTPSYSIRTIEVGVWCCCGDPVVHLSAMPVG